MCRRYGCSAVFIGKVCFRFFGAVCKCYAHILYGSIFTIRNSCGNSVFNGNYNTFRELNRYFSVNHFDVCVFNRLALVCNNHIVAINCGFTLAVRHIGINGRHYDLSVFVCNCSIGYFCNIFNCNGFILNRCTDRIKYGYSNAVCIADSLFIGKCNSNCLVLIVLNIGIGDKAEFVIYNNIKFINTNLAVFICISVRSRRKCQLSVNIGFSFLNIICFAECYNRNICLRLSVMVGDSNDNGVFACRLNTFGKVNNYIVAFSDINITVRNNSVCFIGYGNNIGFFLLVIFFTDCAVVIARIAFAVRNNKLSVCICQARCLIAVYIFNTDI